MCNSHVTIMFRNITINYAVRRFACRVSHTLVLPTEHIVIRRNARPVDS
jgi:hypothetical protein